MKMKGEGVIKDEEGGLEYLKEAISKGSSSAKYKYGKYLITKNADDQTGIEYIRSAAIDGDCKANCYYGLMLEKSNLNKAINF